MDSDSTKTDAQPATGDSVAGDSTRIPLVDGSKVAVIGGGPAGSIFTSFLLDFAEMMGIDLGVDLFEPREFTVIGPKACNMCGGIISETLVQNLAFDGIPLPETVVQRGIDSYVLHMNKNEVRIATPLAEKRIGTVHRGAGPRDLEKAIWDSFDGFLHGRCRDKGARWIPERVTEMDYTREDVGLSTKTGEHGPYDLVVIAAGVNTAAHKIFDKLGIPYTAPRSVKTYIREYRLGAEVIEQHLGNSMHVFLLDLPGLEFAAMIPKGEYVTMCLLGESIDKEMLEAFLSSPEVQSCMPPDWSLEEFSCQCSPSMVIDGAMMKPVDRLMFIGDSGTTRLYKDGIGAAYRTAKAAARTAIFHGVSAGAIEKQYMPVCRGIEKDNRIGKLIFKATSLVQKSSFSRNVILESVRREQSQPDSARRMSMVLWDMFTGSASYGEILKRTMHPEFLGGLARAVAVTAVGRNGAQGNGRAGESVAGMTRPAETASSSNKEPLKQKRSAS